MVLLNIFDGLEGHELVGNISGIIFIVAVILFFMGRKFNQDKDQMNAFQVFMITIAAIAFVVTMFCAFMPLMIILVLLLIVYFFVSKPK